MIETPLMPHHQRALDLFLSRVEESRGFQAVILTGSVAAGRARPDSDIDCCLVVGEEENAARTARHELAHFESCDYEGGYVDGKVISRNILEAAALRGSEPTRSSFVGGRVVLSRVGNLQPLVDEIGQYPEADREQNITDFYCHFVLHAAGSPAYIGGDAALPDARHRLTDCGVSNEAALSRFMELDEWSWVTGTTAVSHR